MKLQPSWRLRNFLIWTMVTCVLLGIQKVLYNDAPYVQQQTSTDLTMDLTTEHETANQLNESQTDPQTFPFHPFVKNQPKMVIILTYQRSGSTFFGSMFNKNPGVFYMFEPLDAFYSSFYGTSMKWNVPSDITSYENGSDRIPPKNELQGVSKYLSSLLSCDLASLPPEALIHPYIYYYKTSEYQAAGAFIKCIDQYQQLVLQCSARSPTRQCGFRFGEKSEERLQECHRALHDQQFRSKHSKKAEFDKYFMCMRSLKKIIFRKCLPSLQTQCDNRQLRVAKIVRGTMLSMESIIKRFPNFRIIHLIRDPRAVVLSRKYFDYSAVGLYTMRNLNETMIREAKLLCSSVTRDIKIRLELEQKYPGRIYPIIYDDMVRDMQTFVHNVYRFLDFPDQRGTSWWKNTIKPLKASDSISRANKWQDTITFEQNRGILSHCSELFQLVKAQHWLQ